MTAHDRALADVLAAAQAAIEAGGRIVHEGEGPWASSVLAAAERLVFEIDWYARDVERLRADEAARRKEKQGG
jgi:hypothetical protein